MKLDVGLLKPDASAVLVVRTPPISADVRQQIRVALQSALQGMFAKVVVLPCTMDISAIRWLEVDAMHIGGDNAGQVDLSPSPQVAQQERL